MVPGVDQDRNIIEKQYCYYRHHLGYLKLTCPCSESPNLPHSNDLPVYIAILPSTTNMNNNLETLLSLLQNIIENIGAGKFE